MSMPIPEMLTKPLVTYIASVTNRYHDDIQELASIVDKDVTLLDFIETLRLPTCSNEGCDNVSSNYSSECFECRYSVFGSEWQREQEER